ncbi:amino acid synthesis family protein [uncultured Albimonas sp.]|uniref:amino acid synthesis family protein n=1 Tax=uncultured Albimonas sp. TaxID=1331701 RepID=UPI0030EE325C|tara:strand:- start:7 stop:588 length:582 start_codon:yes stop_codon:yes gene_type:complete
MPEFRLRRTALTVEEIHHEGGPAPEAPRRRAAIVAIVSNPFAGRYAPDLQGAMDDLTPLGESMAARLVEAMGGPGNVDAYGKGAIVGEGGEIEHGALWHVPGGYAMRGLIRPSKAIVPSAMKVGGMGARLDVPLGHVNAAYVRSHFDAMEVGLPDGPRAGEILFALVMAQGGRVHSRMGGLEAGDVAGEDGLR